MGEVEPARCRGISRLLRCNCDSSVPMRSWEDIFRRTGMGSGAWRGPLGVFDGGFASQASDSPSEAASG